MHHKAIPLSCLPLPGYREIHAEKLLASFVCHYSLALPVTGHTSLLLVVYRVLWVVGSVRRHCYVFLCISSLRLLTDETLLPRESW